MHQYRFIQKLGLFISVFSLVNGLILAETPAAQDTIQPAAELSAVASDKVIDYSQYIKDKLLMPRNLYILKGDASTQEALNVYYPNVLSTLLPTYRLHSYGEYGQSLDGRWIFKSPADLLPSQSFSLNMVANTGTDILSSRTNVEIVDKTNQDPVRLLAIGDSLTRAGVYLSHVQNKLNNVTLLGTRYYPEDGLPAREGRGGWSLEDYFTFNNVQNLDSPFMFPVDISGEHYKGNTRDWKNICYADPDSAVYNGFQKLARGWKDEGPFLYDENGYYRYPVTGDVMYDPSCGWIEWDGTLWTRMQEQPTEFEFSFSKYMEKNKAAFSAGSPTHVSILLGANEFGLNKYIDKMDLYIDQLNQMIDSIHAYDPSIKIILCLPTLGPNTAQVTSLNKKIYTEYNLCMKYTAARLLEAFDTDEALSRLIYIAPMTLTVDPNHGFTFVTKYETYNEVTGKVQQSSLPYAGANEVIDAQNSIHPNNTTGQIQMGDTLAAVIQKTR